MSSSISRQKDASRFSTQVGCTRQAAKGAAQVSNPGMACRVAALLQTRDLETAHLLPINADLDERLRKADFGGIHHDRRTPIFDRYPLGLQIHLKRAYLDTAGPTCRILLGEARQRAIDEGRGTDSYFQADIELGRTDAALSAAFVDAAFNDDELRERAAIFSRYCYRVARDNPPDRALYLASAYARRQRIQPAEPAANGPTATGCLNRLTSKRWWLRALRRTYVREAEELLRARGLVQKGAGLYVSNAALQALIDRSASSFRTLERAVATNDLGQSFSLADLSAASVSNPAIRRAELMVRMRGFERYGTDREYIAALFVLTLPSRFHRTDAAGRDVSGFDGSTVRDGQNRLNQQWQRTRAWLSHRGIQYYGLRTVEPHHDGTPHWNVLIFASQEDLGVIAKALERYFLLCDSPDEPGAREHRIRCTWIDSAKGGATAYVAKYISKNIDGVGVGEDLEDSQRKRSAIETCIRAEAWARIHGIRQFQFFGGPPVSVWRELRRLGEASFGAIENARQAAEIPDWCAFVVAMGGTGVATAARPVRLHRVTTGTVGMYGDPVGPEVVGLESDGWVTVTRIREWFIDWSPQFERPKAVSGPLLPWSTVNNCTPQGSAAGIEPIAKESRCVPLH